MALALFALAAPSWALAGPANDARLVVKTFKNVSTGQVVKGSASCPTGSRAVGGGYGSSGAMYTGWYFPRFDEPLASTGKPPRAGRPAARWRARVDESAPDPYDYKISVVCSKHSDATVVTKRFKVPSERYHGAVAMCPQGSRAIGGGLAVPTAAQGHTLIVDTGPIRTETSFSIIAPKTGQSARGWAATAFNGTATTERPEAVALCSHDSKAVAQTTTADVLAGSAEGKLVSCPAHSRATDGGFVVHPFLSGGGMVPFNEAANTPLASGGIAATKTGAVPRSWFPAVDNHTSGSITVDFVAICEPR